MRGLYGIADATSGGDPAIQIDALLEGGCRLIQLRCKGWGRSDLLRAARDARERTASAGTLFVVNDDPEVAREVGADGVHVGQTDADASVVRAIVGEGALIGVSHNTLDELLRSPPDADYLAVGPMWATSNLSRPKDVAGLLLLREARAHTSLPVVAIGGITPDRVEAVRHAGADAWAVIGAIASASDRVAAVRAFVERG